MTNTYETEKIDGTYYCLDDEVAIGSARMARRQRDFDRYLCEQQASARAYAGLTGQQHKMGIFGWPY